MNTAPLWQAMVPVGATPDATDDPVELSIIIVNFNTRAALRDCLQSVVASRGLPSAEVFVVDNASADGSATMVATEFPTVRLIRSPRNGGYAYGNNLALRQATGRFILLLNPDTIVAPNALVMLLISLRGEIDIGAMGPKLVRADGRLDLACRRSFPTPAIAFYRMIGLSRLFPRHPRFGRYNLTYLDPDAPTDVDALVGACMLIRREAIEQVGLLDEQFFMYGEDLDWAYRMKERGWRIRYNPEVTILHLKGESSRRNSEQATIAFYRAMHLFYAKHYGAAACQPLRWVILGGIYARLAWALLRNAMRPPGQRRVST